MRILLILIIISFQTYAQDTLLYNKKGNRINKEEQKAYYSLKNEHRNAIYRGREVNQVILYYLTGEVHSVGGYQGIDNSIKHGRFSYYYRNGVKQAEGIYEEGMKVGRWTTWHKNKSLKDKVLYEKLVKPSLNNYTVLAYYDTLGNELVTEGNGKFQTWSTSGLLESEGNVKNGKKTGEWKGYKDGILYYQEAYNNGELLQGQSYDSTGRIFKYTEIETNPTPKDGYPKFYQHIFNHLRYPAQARKLGIEGKVYVRFIVDKEGNITDPKVVKGIGSGCDIEALRAVQKAPPWTSPLQRGQKVKQQIILPITFKLG